MRASEILSGLAGFVRENQLYIGLYILLVVVATIISSEFSRDSVAYNDYIIRYGKHGWERFFEESAYLEAFYVFLSKLIYRNDLWFMWVFLIHAILSIGVKLYLLRRYSRDLLLSLSFFLSYFFILHDSTQIRFSLAVAFSYLGLTYLAERKYLVFIAMVCVSALLFHTAIIVFLLMLLFVSRDALKWAFALLVVAVLLYPLDLNAMLLGVIEGALKYFELEVTRFNKLYNVMVDPSSDVFLGMFTPITLLVYVCAFAIYPFRDRFNPFEVLCYNAFILSIAFYILLKDIPDLQVRFGDMFGFSLVFLVPFVHRWIAQYSNRWIPQFSGERIAYLILMSFFIVHLFKYTLIDKMLVF